MSPRYFYGSNAFVFAVDSIGGLNWDYVYGTSGVCPVISLKADVQLTGTGTTDDPYVVVGAE